MNSNFILLNKTYETVEYMNKIIANFPKKDIVLKQSIEKNLYQLVELLFNYSVNKNGRIRDKYLKDYIVQLGMLNFYTQQALLKKYISYKKAEQIGKIYLDLRKIVFTILKGVTSDKV